MLQKKSKFQRVFMFLRSTAILFSMLAFSQGAFASDTDYAGEPVSSQRQLVLDVGAYGLFMPRYEGSDEMRVLAFPVIIPGFVGGPEGPSNFAFRGLDDLRYSVLRRQGFVAGVTGGYTFGRDEDAAGRLTGLGDVDGGIVAGGFVGYENGPFQGDISFHRKLTGDSTGFEIRAGVQAERQVTDRVTLTARLGTTYATDQYMDAYFSVSPAQAITSPLPVYDADAGFKDVHLQLSSAYEITDRWRLNAGLKYSHLLGDVADSPIVENEHQLSGNLGLTYRFYTGRSF
jgi:outer membrane protein